MSNHDAEDFQLYETAVSAPRNKIIITPTEFLAVFASYALAYIYTFILDGPYAHTWLAIFTFLFVVLVEIVYRGRSEVRHNHAETGLWLAAMFIMPAAELMGRNRVWGELIYPFLHCYAIYYLMSRSGRLVEGRSSRFFLYDAVRGAVIIPFRHFLLRLRILISRVSEKFMTKHKVAVWSTFAAAAVGLIFFVMAMYLLSSADITFERWFSGISAWLNQLSLDEILIRLIWSLPIGAYLYGLIVGSSRETRDDIEHRSAQIDSFLLRLRLVPVKVWSSILLFFVAFYLLFFVVQGSYLFSAFSRQLPAGFTYAVYARRGFFELCSITAMNFALLWVVSRSSDVALGERRLLRSMMTVLLLENLLFAGIAFSKLALYISVYGFTMLRVQSAWLVTMLFVGCLCWLYSLWYKKNALPLWIYFCGSTLALLTLY